MSKVIVEPIESKIYFIRGIKVMLDKDLATLYGIPTKRLNEQVRRNIKRFPEDFMLRLTSEEMQFLRSQNATLERGGYSKYQARIFTEQGIAMLSGIINSDRAIAVNIAIMRTFVKMRQVLVTHRDLADRLEKVEERLDHKDKEIISLFEAIRQLIREEEKPKHGIGFHVKYD